MPMMQRISHCGTRSTVTSHKIMRRFTRHILKQKCFMLFSLKKARGHGCCQVFLQKSSNRGDKFPPPCFKWREIRKGQELIHEALRRRPAHKRVNAESINKDATHPAIASDLSTCCLTVGFSNRTCSASFNNRMLCYLTWWKCRSDSTCCVHKIRIYRDSPSLLGWVSIKCYVSLLARLKSRISRIIPFVCRIALVASTLVWRLKKSIWEQWDFNVDSSCNNTV